MKKLTIASFIGLAIILFSLLGVTYYVSKNYVPPPSPVLSDSLALISDSTYLLTDSALTKANPNLDSVRQKTIDSAAIAQNMLITSVLNDSLSKTTSSSDVLPKEKEASQKNDIKEIIVETPPQSTTSSKTPIVSAKGVESGAYYVVVGTFTQEVNAKDAMKHSHNNKLSILKDGNYFRLVAGEFSNAKLAKQKSQELTTEGISNFIIHR